MNREPQKVVHSALLYIFTLPMLTRRLLKGYIDIILGIINSRLEGQFCCNVHRTQLQLRFTVKQENFATG